MSETMWHYMNGPERCGPVSETEFRAIITQGRLAAETLVWASGMPQWMPLSQVASPLMATSPVAYSGHPSAVGYYNPAAGLPPRALETLKGHASPRGDTTEWPLDDAHLFQFESAFRLRKKISSAAQLYRFLFLLSAVGAAFVVIGAGISLVQSNRMSAAGIPFAVSGALLAGLTVFYALAWKATTKSRCWAPLTMFILNLLGILLELVATIVSATSNTSSPGETVGPFISMLFAAAFAYVSWRAYTAIPRFLQCPAWCQELLVKTKI